MLTKQNIINHVLVIFLIFTYSTCLKTTINNINKKDDSDLNFTFFAQKHLDMISFSNKLQQTHLQNFNQIQEQILTFALSQSTLSTEDIKKNLINYFKHIEANVDMLNKEFTKQYSYCTNELKTIFFTCKSNEKMEKDIKFNKRYIKTLQRSVIDYDGLISQYYDSNMLFFAKGVCNINEKNNVIDEYEKIEKHLKKYFHLKDENTDNLALVQTKVLENVNTSEFVERLNKFFTMTQTGENVILDQSQYIKDRENMAQKLFNKIVLYKNNAEVRKQRMTSKNLELIQKLKDNDNSVLLTLSQLKKKNKDNAELILALSNDNELLRKKIRKCEILNNLNLKCEEMAKIYKSIVSGYEEQAKSLEKIYKLIK